MKIHPPALSYRPARPADFANFWKATLIAQRELPLQARLTRRDYLIAQIEVYDVRFKGFGGAELAGIYLLPKQRSKRLPVVLQSHGYTWHKGEPLNHLHWIMLGMAVLAVDVRGQAGDSADNQGYPGGHAAGYMTQGILDPAAYYY
ncbi:MAG: acetylxylan esterase, partial [candidate division FCPU426 bacterium]